MRDHLQLDLGLPLRADLLAPDVRVAVDHGEGLLRPRHPPQPLAHQVQHTVVLFVADMGGLKIQIFTIFYLYFLVLLNSLPLGALSKCFSPSERIPDRSNHDFAEKSSYVWEFTCRSISSDCLLMLAAKEAAKDAGEENNTATTSASDTDFFFTFSGSLLMFSGTFFSDANWDRALEGRPSRNLSFGGTFLLKTALLNGFSFPFHAALVVWPKTLCAGFPAFRCVKYTSHL